MWGNIILYRTIVCSKTGTLYNKGLHLTSGLFLKTTLWIISSHFSWNKLISREISTSVRYICVLLLNRIKQLCKSSKPECEDLLSISLILSGNFEMWEMALLDVFLMHTKLSVYPNFEPNNLYKCTKCMILLSFLE